MATYYVAKTGLDSNPGTESLPWLTLKKATNTLVAGDTVYIKAGTYNEVLNPARSGTASGWITFSNYMADVVNINAPGTAYCNTRVWYNYIRFLGLNFTGFVTGAALDANGISYLTLFNCFFTNCAKSGIEVNNSNHILVDTCETFGTNLTPMNECISFSTVDTFEIRNCKVHDAVATQRNGIDTKVGCRNGIVHHNEVYNVYNALYVDSRGNSDNIKFYYNDIHDTVADALGINDELNIGTITNIWFYNNIVYRCHRAFSVYDGVLINFNFINNTLYSNAASGFTEIWIDAPASRLSNCVVRNNIVFSTAVNTYGIWYADYANGNVAIDHNLSYNSAGAWHSGNMLGEDAVTLDPQFVNPSIGDFRLQPGSPAIGTGYGGVNIGAEDSIAFPSGVVKTAKVPVTVIPSGIPCTMEVWLGTNINTKVTTSGQIMFTSTGNSQLVSAPIMMPIPGQYNCYIDLRTGSYLFASFNDQVVIVA